MDNRFLIKILFSFSLISLLNNLIIAQNVAPYASCINIYQKKTFEKNYPCAFTEPVLCSVLTDPNYPIEFRCNNVPNNTLLSYDIVHLNSVQIIDHSVSVWWNNIVGNYFTVNSNIFSQFLNWAQTSKNLRNQVSPNCVNYPLCLNVTCNEYAVNNFILSFPSDGIITRTVSVFINNENQANTYDPMDFTTIINNSLTISSNIYIQ